MDKNNNPVNEYYHGFHYVYDRKVHELDIHFVKRSISRNSGDIYILYLIMSMIQNRHCIAYTVTASKNGF